MSQLLIPDLDEQTLARLRDRAARHGRTAETEAKAILSDALPATNSWSGADAIFAELTASGRAFSDSVELLREDRDR